MSNTCTITSQSPTLHIRMADIMKYSNGVYDSEHPIQMASMYVGGYMVDTGK